MLRAIDVAHWFLSKEPMTHKKLQKMCYYAQGWHLALLDTVIFEDRIEAWIHGPVIPSLYRYFADYGWNLIPKCDQQIIENKNTLDLLEAVYDTYRKFSGDQLEYLSHRETPWLETRGGLSPVDACSKEISTLLMKNYFKSLYANSQND